MTLEETEVRAVELAHLFTKNDEFHSSKVSAMTWKEYVASFDKHLHTELVLTKVLF
jgi:hypothetical protein